LMSSAVKTWLPISTVSPTRMSSKNFMSAVPLARGRGRVAGARSFCFAALGARFAR
jgi:hypothetical protein